MEIIVNSLLLYGGICLLIYDGYLELTGRTTISRWYQRLFPRLIDWILFAGGMILLMSLPSWVIREVLLVWAGFWGHITIANKERYGE